MQFEFEVKLSDEDYYEYNNFMFIKSFYGKKRMATFRITLALIFAVFALGFLIFSNIPFADRLIGVIPQIIICLIAQLLLKPFLKLSVKQEIKYQKKSGKAAYSSESLMQFSDDYFAEKTENGKTENQYSAIERISILPNCTYIHLNSVLGYIIPKRAFESNEKYRDFAEFISSKCDKVEKYN